MSAPLREFRPPVRRSTAALVLAGVLGLVLLVSGALLGTIALGSSQVTYTLHGGTLTVDSGSFLDGSHAFALSDVTDAHEVTLSGGRRTRGTGAPGLCTGIWWYPDLGSVWQATDCSPRAVVLTVTGEPRPVVFSPPDPVAFLAQLDARTDTFVPLAPGSATVMRVVPGLGALTLLVISVMLTAVFVAGPKRMRYVVGDGQLEVHTIFSSRRWPARDLRARLHTPKVTLRLAGTAFPGYYTGLFRSDGATTRIYATELRSGVLLEGPARVFLSPESPAAFLEALKREGATVDSAA
jgi:hypothetical protein